MRALRNELGVALPTMLVALMVASLIGVGLVLTTKIEGAAGRASAEAMSHLHEMDGAVSSYVGERARLAPLDPAGGLLPVDAEAWREAAITVSRLTADLDTLPADSLALYETFQVSARPADGRGRGVAALITTVRKLQRFRVDVNAGITVGGNLAVGGNSTISDGRSASCALPKSENAVQVSAGSSVTVQGGANVVGAVDTATWNKAEMVRELLRGLSLQEAAQLATVKFGPGEFAGRARSYDVSGPRARSHRYNWGCPPGAGCAASAGDNVDYMPMVAIDAGGGVVTINGDHGQGVLIVHNGSLRVQGNFVYRGIVLVEEDLDIRGTGGSTSTKIEGAVLALGESSTVQDNITGDAVITYNRCSVEEAQNRASESGVWYVPQQFPAPLFGWQEVF